jgi:ribose transport system ATP-binding protein
LPALATGASVLVLDRPTSSLASDVRRLFALIARLKRQGLAIVYISHFIEEVMEVSVRFVVLRDGRNAGAGMTSQARGDDIVSLMVGRTLEDLYPRRTRHAGEPILTVEDLGSDRLAPASFSLYRGEILGIAGLLGAGRTRLLRALFGLDAVKSGAVKLGMYAGPWTASESWDRGVGLLSENRTGEGLALALSVADNMTLTRLEGLGPAFFVSPSRQRAASRKWIEQLGIKTSGPGQRVAGLSGGNQQKVALARLLHHGVDVLLLDSRPGIDVSSKLRSTG